MPARRGEPLQGLALHGLGRGRRVRRVRRRARGVRVSPLGGRARPPGSAAPVRGHHRVPRAAPGRGATRRAARHLRLRCECAHHRPDRPGAGSGGARPHPGPGRAPAGSRAGRLVGRSRSRRSPCAARLRHRVRTRRRARPGCVGGPRPERHPGGGRHPPERHPRSRLPAPALPGEDTNERHLEHPGGRRGAAAAGRTARRPGDRQSVPLRTCGRCPQRPRPTTGFPVRPS